MRERKAMIVMPYVDNEEKCEVEQANDQQQGRILKAPAYKRSLIGFILRKWPMQSEQESSSACQQAQTKQGPESMLHFPQRITDTRKPARQPTRIINSSSRHTLLLLSIDMR